VPEKTQDQLDLQALHRVRDRLVSRRTATINQIRCFLLEHGIAVRPRTHALRVSLEPILMERANAISPRMRDLLLDLQADWLRLDDRIEAISQEIKAISEADEECRRLMSVPGIGPIISSAIVAAIGTGDAFTRGRDFAAWLGLVPRQYSTGGKTVLDV
jgi:transposase